MARLEGFEPPTLGLEVAPRDLGRIQTKCHQEINSHSLRRTDSATKTHRLRPVYTLNWH